MHEVSREQAPAQVLVAGFGDLGAGLAEQLAGSPDFEVKGLRRRPVQSVCPVWSADLCNPDSLQDVPRRFDYLVYTATPEARTPEAYRAAYRQGLENILAHLELGCLQRVLFVSSTAVYGQQQGEWVDESSVTAPSAFSGQILLDTEQWLYEQPVPATRVRFAGIYGPGRERLIRKVLAGCEATPEPPSYTNRIHRADCVAMLARLLADAKAGHAVPDVVLGVDQEPASEWDVLCWLAQQLDVPGPQAVPGTGKQNKRCQSQWLAASGMVLRYPDFRAGYGAEIAAWKAQQNNK